MSARPAELQAFLDVTGETVTRRVPPNTAAGIAAARIFGALDRPVQPSAVARPARVPGCRHLDGAIDRARHEGSDIARVATALAAVEPLLAWEIDARAESLGVRFVEGHADAMIVGPGGLEPRDDLWIGVSLMGPGLQYPDHRHPLEEIYLALSPGEWRQEAGPWHEPGIGGTVYNPPDIVHSMRSIDAPLLAIWCLWPRP